MARKNVAKKLSAILVGEDSEVADSIVGYLSNQNIDMTVVADGREMDHALEAKKYDLLILDLMLAGEDGFSICKRIREQNSILIITTSSSDDRIDKILSLEMGADDYIHKPLDPREILARIRALSRRIEMSMRLKSEHEQVYLFSDWRLDAQIRKLVSPNGNYVSLTSAECGVLHVFCENPGQVLSRNRLIELTHDEIDCPSERSVDIIVSRLRHKIETNAAFPKIIRTIRFEGYIFTSPVEQMRKS